jgi:hypothetical protein
MKKGRKHGSKLFMKVTRANKACGGSFVGILHKLFIINISNGGDTRTFPVGRDSLSVEQVCEKLGDCG